MTETSYIYFGDKLFHKLHKFVSKNSLWFHHKSDKVKIFSSVQTSPKLYIDEIYLGWSYIIYRIGDALYHVGFPHTKGESSAILKTLTTKDLIVACGTNKVCAVTSDRKFYCYSTQNLEPNIYDLPDQKLKIQTLAIGDFHTIALMHDGAVCIINLEETFSLVPIPLPCPIAEVACGKEHAIFLSSSGQVFSYGNGSRGQLGHGTIENYNQPTLLEALDGIQMKAIACGGWHSAAISYTGDLYMWGWNESGQLGFPCAEKHGDSLLLSEIETVCCLPKIVELEDEKQITAVSCGTRHTAILTEDFQVWTWGWNEYGQLGHNEYPLCDKPYKIRFDGKFIPKKIKCAFWSTLIWGSYIS